MFSRSDPTHPQKVMMNMRIPTTNNIIAGSTDRQARAVSERFLIDQMNRFTKSYGLEQNSRNKNIIRTFNSAFTCIFHHASIHTN